MINISQFSENKTIAEKIKLLSLRFPKTDTKN